VHVNASTVAQSGFVLHLIVHLVESEPPSVDEVNDKVDDEAARTVTAIRHLISGQTHLARLSG